MKRINLILCFVASLMAANTLTGCSEDIGLEKELGFKPIEIPTTPDISLDAKESAIHSEIDDLGLQLLKNILAEGENEDIALSPISAMAAASLFDNTKIHCYGSLNDFSSLIKDGHIDDVNSMFNKIIRFLPDKSHECDVNIGNSIWLPIQSTPDVLKKIAATQYFAEVFNYSYDDCEWMKETSRKWMELKTNGRVSDFKLDSGIETSAYTVNVIFFNGKWKSPFDPDDVKIGVFHGITNDIQMEFMTAILENIQYLEEENWTAIALPFRGNYEMIFVQPTEGISLGDAVDALSLKNRLKFKTAPDCWLWLPKFSIRNNRVLNKFFNTNVSVELSQITSVEVNEEGAEANAITIGHDGGLSLNMILDRPFLFSIVNRVSGTSLMIGAVMNPAAGK